MASARRKGAGGKRRAVLWRIAGALALVAIVGGAWGWWSLRAWQPDRAAFPVQGAEIGSADGTVDWPRLASSGAEFVYLDASASAFARDETFSANLEGARQAGLKVGAVHLYDPCQPADAQAANFVTVVPRDAAMLPPVVDLDRQADDCPVSAGGGKVGDAKVESELMVFLNQVETHAGKAVILKISRDFEARYGVGARLDRKLWLVSTRFVPEYAGRPFALWTANEGLANDVAERPLRWVVVQP